MKILEMGYWEGDEKLKTFQNLEAEIKRTGLTKEEFCKKLGISTRGLWNKATGRTKWDLEAMRKVQKAINEMTHQDLSLEYLFVDDN